MDMQPGTVLNAGDEIRSGNGRYRFVYQADGNLVLYGPGGALWDSQTDGTQAGVCTMQTDGNLVIYTPGEEPIWASATDNNPDARLIIQDDGNAVIYSTDNTPLWATDTALPDGPAAQDDEMQPGTVLNAGDEIRSGNGRYRFVYQADGNLVLYGPGGALWDSQTDGTQAGVCTMQTDGNLVIYTPGEEPIWASATDNNPDARLIIQDDGNAVVYSTDNTPLWATDTALPDGPAAQDDEMQPGTVLNAGDEIRSGNGRYRFVYQADGNLVLYGPGGALWDSQTDGTQAGVCTMQTDGNLVIYTPGEEPIWASATDNNPDARLIIQDDGNAVIYNTDNTPLWATGTQQES